jgi:hypothetical protein
LFFFYAQLYTCILKLYGQFLLKVVKLSSTAAQQATELTKKVNENVKEGTLFSSLTYGVGSVSSKMSDLGSKAITNMNTYWTGDESGQMKASSSSNSMNFFGKSGYDSLSGQSNSNNNFNNNNNNNNNNSGSYGSGYNNDNFNKNQNDRVSNSKNNSSKKSDDWDWNDSSWENAPAKTNNKTTGKTNSGTKKAKDLIDFDDDSWEPIEPSKSK